MLTISEIETRPLGYLDYHTASRRGKRKAKLPPLCGRVRGLPRGLEGVIAAADLQGRDDRGKLLGQSVGHALRKGRWRRHLPGGPLGVLLAGDLYAHANLSRMGGKGEVRSVWASLARSRRWVAGVLGNHDLYRGEAPEDRIADEAYGAPMHLLNGQAVALDGLHVGGAGGVVKGINTGSPEEQRYLRRVAGVLARSPDVLLLHHGPSARPGHDLGLVRLRQMVQQASPTLVIYGHKPSELLQTLPSGAQLLNVRERVVLLLREG